MRGTVEKEWEISGYKAKVKIYNLSMPPVAAAMDLGTAWRCGYVRLPKDHAWSGKSYRDDAGITWDSIKNTPVGKRGPIDLFCMAANMKDNEPVEIGHVIDVHGSVTYMKEEADGFTWIGYDCNHCDDNPETQDLEYCIGECESLVKQLKETKK